MKTAAESLREPRAAPAGPGGSRFVESMGRARFARTSRSRFHGSPPPGQRVRANQPQTPCYHATSPAAVTLPMKIGTTLKRRGRARDDAARVSLCR